MVPLESLVSITERAAPQVISHYDLFRSAEINGSPAPGHSSGQALAEMEKLARRVLPPGIGYSWSGLSLEEIESAGKSFVIFRLGILFGYLTLAAQYESFVLPFIISQRRPAGDPGARFPPSPSADSRTTSTPDRPGHAIGLASKNAIPDRQFAEQSFARAAGRSPTRRSKRRGSACARFS
jgi:HAE1 family hydrophobic/amphiphilic exporter-1